MVDLDPSSGYEPEDITKVPEADEGAKKPGWTMSRLPEAKQAKADRLSPTEKKNALYKTITKLQGHLSLQGITESVRIDLANRVNDAMNKSDINALNNIMTELFTHATRFGTKRELAQLLNDAMKDGVISDINKTLKDIYSQPARGVQEIEEEAAEEASV